MDLSGAFEMARPLLLGSSGFDESESMYASSSRDALTSWSTKSFYLPEITKDTKKEMYCNPCVLAAKSQQPLLSCRMKVPPRCGINSSSR